VIASPEFGPGDALSEDGLFGGLVVIGLEPACPGVISERLGHIAGAALGIYDRALPALQQDVVVDLSRCSTGRRRRRI
jgi:hypothetical protein